MFQVAHASTKVKAVGISFMFASTLHRFNVFAVRFAFQPSPDPAKRIEELVHYAFLQRNDRIVGNLNIFGANLSAAFRNVAVPDTLRLPQLLNPVFGIKWMHLQRGYVHQKPRTNELVVLVMIAQDVADILAEKTFDAFPEFFDPIDIALLHPPRSIRRVRRAGFEWFDHLLHSKIP